MKKLTLFFIAGLLLLIAFTGCKQKLNPFGGNTVLSDEEVNEVNTTEETVYINNTAEDITDMGVTLNSTSLAPFADQQFKVTFANGVVDSDTIDAGILLFLLTDTAAADGAYTRGEAVTINNPVVIPDGAGGSSVVGTLDLSGTAVSNQIEVQLVAGTLTANGGTVTLNEDGDYLEGETEERQDDFFGYISVTGAPVTAAGSARNPQAAVSVTPRAINDGDTTLVFDALNTAGGTNRMTADSLSAGISFSMRAADGSWTALSPTETTTYADTTGELTFTFGSEFEIGNVYRIAYDNYNIAEGESVNGFIHRSNTSHDEIDRYTYDYGTPESHEDILEDRVASSASVTGTEDLSGGYDWSATNETFELSYDGGAAATVTLDANAGNLGDIQTELLAEIEAAVGPDLFTVNLVVGMYVEVSLVETGDDHYFTLAAGDPEDALATLGLAAGTYVGDDAWTYKSVDDEWITDGLAVGGEETSRWIEMNFEGTKVKNASADTIGLMEFENYFTLTGTEDLSGGYQWGWPDRAEFTLTLDGTDHHISLTSNYYSLTQIINRLNDELPDGVSARSVDGIDGKYVELYSTEQFDTVEISHTSYWGYDNALPQFGWTAGDFDNEPDIRWVDLSEAAFYQPEDRAVRMQLPPDFEAAYRYKLYFYPSLVDEGATTDATDDIPYFTDNTIAGAASWYDNTYGATTDDDWDWRW